MSCSAPVSFELLVALWAGELDDPEAVEEHLFACESCAATAAAIDRLIGSLGTLVPPVLTSDQHERLAARGLKIRELTFSPGERGEAFFARDLDLYLFRLRADFAGVKRVDLEIVDTNGDVHFHVAHVPFDATRGEVLVACQQHFRSFADGFPGAPEFRVVAQDGGTRRELGAYVIKHVWPPL